MGLTIALQTADGPLPLRAGPGQGVRLAQEPLVAPPRRTSIELLPFDAVATVALRQAGGVIPLEATVEGGNLRVEGVPPGRLKGTFELRTRVDDVEIARNRFGKAAFDAAGQGQVTLPAKLREIRLTRPVGQFDPAIRDVVTGPSRIDGLSTDAWLESRLAQAKRKACLLNLLAVLRATRLGERDAVDPLLEVLVAGTDHMGARVGAELFQLVSDAAMTRNPPAGRRVYVDSPVHPSHVHALQELGAQHGLVPADFKSFRFEGRPSLQIVFGIPAGVAESHLVDIDLDLGNPRQDLFGAIVHLGELVDDGLDHVKLRSKLVKGPAAPFIYYDAA